MFSKSSCQTLVVTQSLITSCLVMSLPNNLPKTLSSGNTVEENPYAIHYEPDDSKWTDLQEAQYTFAQAVEMLPAIWDIRHPGYNDMEFVMKCYLALTDVHKDLFKLPKKASVLEVQELYDEMFRESRRAMEMCTQKYGVRAFEQGPLEGPEHYQEILAYTDSICSYTTAMIFSSPSFVILHEMVDALNGLKLIKDENGQKLSVRYSDGTVDHLRTTPLCLIKLKLSGEIERYPAYLEKRGEEVKNRIECQVLQQEEREARDLFAAIMTMKDDQ